MPKTESIELVAGLLNQAPWMAIEFYNNSIGDYITVLGSVLFVYLITRVFTWLLEKHARRFTKQTTNRIDDQIVELVHRSITFICVLTVLYFGILSLELPELIDQIAAKVLFVLFTLKIARELDRFSLFFIKSYLQPFAGKQRGTAKTFLAPLSRVSKIIIWALAILLIAGNLGYNITSLLAGLGVGGLAFALAAQETLSNAFGSLSILSDQPFKVGDWIKLGDVQGSVLEVGLRSTRIKTIDNKIVSIPNKITADSVIENYSQREAFNVDLKIGIGYETPSSTIKELIKSIASVLKKDPAVNNDNFRINITDFGDFAIELTIFYYINDVSTYARSITIRERVNLKIKEVIDESGVDIPFPTQSLRIQNANSLMPTTGRKKANK